MPTHIVHPSTSHTASPHSDAGWAVIPITALISYLLLGIEEIGVQASHPGNVGACRGVGASLGMWGHTQACAGIPGNVGAWSQILVYCFDWGWVTRSLRMLTISLIE